MKNIISLTKYLKLALISAVTLISLSASANITVLAWPGGPAEEALRKVVDNYNKTSDSKAELLYFSRDNFF
jgi:multiple sugar transport system substrate-binding protein